MKISSFTIGFLGLTTVMALSISSAYAAEAASKKAGAMPMLSYKAPLRGAPATRVGGATRSGQATSMTLSVLAPDHTGYTVQDKPTIYWYVSKAITSPVELTVTAPEAIEPLLELTLTPPIKEGIHALRLTDHGIALKPEVEYQWFVAVVTNPDERSKDILAGGSIQRVAASESVRTKLNEVGEIMWPAVYAESGLWYDAVDEISRLIYANPADGGLREQRASLLAQ
ncbi:MAG: DUF928 domain-containing protein, partial [Gammaproteobacteria bacterium]